MIMAGLRFLFAELLRETKALKTMGTGFLDLTCLGIVDTPRSSIFCRYRRCVYERSRNFTSEKAV